MSSIYIIEVEGTDRIKIGFTDKDGQHRLRALDGTSMPGKPNLLHVLPGSKPAESEMHERFSEYRVRSDREWFYRCGALADLLDHLEVLAGSGATPSELAKRCFPIAAAAALEDDAPSTGALLRTLREQRGLTQTQLAMEIGIRGYATISAWENDYHEISRKNLIKLAEYYNIDPAALGLSLPNVVSNSDVRELIDQHLERAEAIASARHEQVMSELRAIRHEMRPA